MKKVFLSVIFMMATAMLPSFVLAKTAVDDRSTAGDLEFSVLAGLRSNSADTNIVRASVQTKSSWFAGVIGVLPLKYNLAVRSGFVYNQRYVEISPTNQGTVSIEYSYFDVPMNLGLRFSDIAMIYGGPSLAFNQSKDVNCTQSTTCAAVDVKSFVMPWQVGIHFLFLPELGAEVAYEFIPGDLSQNVSNMRSITLGAFYTF